MKYLKYFERVTSYDFLEPPKNSSLYKEIGEVVFNDYEFQDFLIFSDKEIKEIKNTIGKINGDTNMISLVGSNYNITNDDIGYYNYITYRNHLFAIYKLIDEYYLVYDYRSNREKEYYYKCDQLDGLINCLEDLLWDSTKG